MAFVGFAYMNPIATMAMLDQGKWRPVVYADTPRCRGQYDRFLAGTPKKDNRKAVLFLFGASNFPKVKNDLDRFTSIFVFDDLQNLEKVQGAYPAFEVTDIEETPEGALVPYHLTPAEMADTVAAEGKIQKVSLLEGITAALSKRKPSVLESTSRMPMPEAVAESGSQRLMTEIKLIIEAKDSDLPFAMVLDTYAKFLFRMLPRSKVTSQVTKKLPAEAKDLWGSAIDFATSDIGLRMAYAFRSLCQNKDPDYRVGHAVSKYGLKAYSGDFLYFTSVCSPNRGFEFLEELSDEGESALTGQPKFKAKLPAKGAKKSRAKKA